MTYNIISENFGIVYTYTAKNEYDAKNKFLDWLDYHSYGGMKEFSYKKGG